jgi:hypothetical protein
MSDSVAETPSPILPEDGLWRLLRQGHIRNHITSLYFFNFDFNAVSHHEVAPNRHTLSIYHVTVRASTPFRRVAFPRLENIDAYFGTY